MKIRILSAILIGLAGLFVSPKSALAVIQRLNGQTGQNQTFQNDTNFSIFSLNNIHSLIWQGFLPVSRGGTGTGSFTSGSLLFSDGTSITEDNSNLFWDDTSNRLNIANASIFENLDVDSITTDSPRLSIDGGSTEEEGNGGGVGIDGGEGGSISGHGGFVSMSSGSANGSGDGGATDLSGGQGGIISGNGGFVQLAAGSARGGNGNGGDILLLAGEAVGSGVKGKIILQDGSAGERAILDTSLLTISEKTFTFPDISGTFGLLEADQIWSGLNKFEASSNSTIYVGSSVKSGCIALGDSDGSGVTYVTANDGVLTASTTKPSVCQ